MGVEACIAVVDDDRGMRDAIEGLVRSLDHDPLCFGSAADFLAHPRREQVACVILDIKMPGMTGLELQRVINGDTHPVPIIFLSSCADGPSRNQATSAGARCVLVKPVDVASLIKCIEDAIASGR